MSKLPSGMSRPSPAHVTPVDGDKRAGHKNSAIGLNGQAIDLAFDLGQRVKRRIPQAAGEKPDHQLGAAAIGRVPHDHNLPIWLEREGVHCAEPVRGLVKLRIRGAVGQKPLQQRPGHIFHPAGASSQFPATSKRPSGWQASLATTHRGEAGGLNDGSTV